MDIKTNLRRAAIGMALCASLAVSAFTVKYVDDQAAGTRELFTPEPVLSVSQNDTEEQETAKASSDNTASVRVTYDDGFVLTDSDIWLEKDGETFAFHMDGTHEALFKSGSDVAKAGAVSALLTGTDHEGDIVCILDNDGTRQAAARRNLTDTISAVVTVDVKDEDDAAAKAAAVSILESAVEVSQKDFLLLGFEIPEEWLKDVMVAENSVSLSNGEETVYISRMKEPVEGTGFDTRLDMENAEVFASDIIDAETGYRLFLLTVGEDRFEILAKSEETIRSLFSTKAE